jgi:hypothetical protein
MAPQIVRNVDQSLIFARKKLLVSSFGCTVREGWLLSRAGRQPPADRGDTGSHLNAVDDPDGVYSDVALLQRLVRTDPARQRIAAALAKRKYLDECSTEHRPRAWRMGGWFLLERSH